MTSSTANPLLLSYFQRQQTPAGWFDLLSVMVDGMVRNVGEAERDYRSAIRGYRSPGMRTARRVGVTHFAPYWKGFIPVGCRDRAGNRISLLAANGFTPYRTLCSATLTHNESEYV